MLSQSQTRSFSKKRDGEKLSVIDSRRELTKKTSISREKKRGVSLLLFANITQHSGCYGRKRSASVPISLFRTYNGKLEGLKIQLCFYSRFLIILLPNRI